MPGDYAALEAARIARGGNDPFMRPVAREAPKKAKAFLRTDFAVGKVYDADDRFVAFYEGMTRDTAEAMAGRKRDEMTEAQVETAVQEGWNWGYRALRGNIGRPLTPFVPSRQLKIFEVCNVESVVGPRLDGSGTSTSTDPATAGVGPGPAGSSPGRVAKFGRMKGAMGSVNKPGFAGMSPERRREISARANAARMAKLTPERRSEIALKARNCVSPEVRLKVAQRASAARWGK